MSDTLYLILIPVLVAALVFGVGAVSRRRGWKWGVATAVVGLAVSLLILARPMCACATDRRVTQARVRAAVEHVVAAEEARFDSGGRYVPIDSLGVEGSLDATTILSDLRDSSFHLLGVSTLDSTLTCSITMVRARHPDLTITCHGAS